MVHGTAVSYGLRARRSQPSLPGEEVVHPAAHAAVSAGLRPKALSKQELLRFRANTSDYLEAR
jgi:hypothetical protein